MIFHSFKGVEILAYDGTLKFDTKIDSGGFEAGLSGIKNAAEQGLGSVGNILNSAADTMAAVGGTLTKKVTAPIVAVGTASVKASMDFDSGMSEVQAISGASGSQLEKLRDKAKEMGAKTKFSASESAEAFKYMAMAGWDTDAMLAGIEGTMNLAAASGESLGTVSDIVTDSMTAFGYSADKAGHFADVLAMASNKSNTNVSMLGESFKYVAPVAGAMGYSVEDTAVALGLMANSGIKASQSGTALRTLITNMAKPTANMSIAMDTLGVSLTNADGSSKSLMEVMEDLRKGFGQGNISAEEFSTKMAELQEGLDSGAMSQADYDEAVQNLTVAMYGAEGAEKARLAAMLAGKEGMAGLLAIVNTSEKDFYSLSDAINDCDGTAQEMADIMSDNLEGDLTKLKSATEALAISIGEILRPVVRAVTQGITDLVNWLNGLDDGTKKTIVTIAGIVAAIGPLLLAVAKVIKICTSVGGAIKTIVGAIKGVPAVVGVLSSAFSGIGTIASTVGGAIASIGSTIVSGIGTVIATLGGPLTLAIVAAIAGIIAIICNWDAVKEFFTKTLPDWWTNTVVPAFGSFVDGVKAVFTEKLPALISDIIAWFAELPAKIGGFFADIIGGAAEWVAEMAGKALELGASFIGKVVEFFTGLPGKIWEFLSGAIIKAGEWIAGMAEKAAEFGAAFIDKVLAFFTDLPYKVGYFLGTVIGTVATWIFDMGAKALELGTAFIDKIVEFFTGLPGKIWDFLVDVVTKVGEWTHQMAEKAAETGRSFIEKVVEFFTQLPGKVWEFLVNTVTKVGEWTYQMMLKAQEAAGGFYNKCVEFFSQLPGKIWEFLSGAVLKAAEWIGQMAQKAVEAGSEFLVKVVEFFTQLPGKVWEFLSGAVVKAAEWAGQMAAKAAEAGKSFLENVIKFITELPGKVWAFLTDVVSGVAKWAKQLWDKGTDAAKTLVKAVVNGVKSLPGKMLEIGKSIIEGVWDGICKAKDAFVKNVKDFFSGIVDGVKDKLGIHSPSKVMQNEVGQPIAEGVAKGINDKAGDAEKSMGNLKDGLLSVAVNLTKAMGAESTAATSVMAANLTKLVSTTPGIMNNLVTSTVTALAGLSSQMGATAEKSSNVFAKSMVTGIKASQAATVASGRDLVTGLWQGISGQSGWLYQSVSKFASGIVDNIKRTLKIGSPSRVMADEVGRWLPSGVGEGFEDAMPALERQIDAEMESLAGRMQAAVEVESRGFAIKTQELAQHKANTETPKGGDTYVEEKIEQTNNYHVPVATPSEVNKANRAAARKLLGGVT